MSKPVFVLPAADLERGPREVSWAIPEGWLREVLSDSDATPRGDGKLELELTKTGLEVVARGRARVSVEMACVVTLDPLPLELEPEIFLLLAPSPKALAAARPARARAQAGAGGVRSARRRPKAAGGWAVDPELSATTAAEDTYDGEKIVLDDFLREFILLELPMYPRRSDLPSGETPANGAPSVVAEPSPAPVDPRLLPLAAIANRLRDQKKD